MAVNTGKIQGEHREFNLNLNVATLYERGSNIKAKQCKTIVTFDTIP